MFGPRHSPGLLVGSWARSGPRLNESILTIGEPFETEKWRAHRYMSSVSVTDLTNAGKRGKKVLQLVLYGMDERSPIANEVSATVYDLVKRGVSVAEMRKAMEAFKGMSAGFEEREMRGIDVLPGGFKPVNIVTDKVAIQADLLGFSVRDQTDPHNLPTCIPRSQGGKRAIPAFYRWVRDNERKIRGMSYGEVLKQMTALDIPYHSYCAMD